MAHLLASIALGFTFLIATPSAAIAWGAEGHRLVADIAWHLLSPTARQAVDALLAAEAEIDPDSRIRTLADAAVWADNIRNARPETRGWHFDNVPLCGQGDPARYCRDRNCASAQIERLRGVLADSNTALRDRLEALKFLVHFVGDIHQPLHTADNNDRGGNDIPVTVAERVEPTNLHTHWDIDLVRNFTAERGHTGRMLSHKISAVEQALWSQGSASEWVAQTHREAGALAYAKLPTPPACGRLPSEPIALDKAYYRSVRPALGTLFKQAGVRLAAILNQTFP
jgi:S1/P1 Nuclease